MVLVYQFIETNLLLLNKEIEYLVLELGPRLRFWLHDCFVVARLTLILRNHGEHLFLQQPVVVIVIEGFDDLGDIGIIDHPLIFIVLSLEHIVLDNELAPLRKQMRLHAVEIIQ